MGPAIGRATGKWFGCRAIGPTAASNGFTAITFVGNIAATTTGIAGMIDGTTAATNTWMTGAATANTRSLRDIFETPACGPAFCFASQDLRTLSPLCSRRVSEFALHPSRVRAGRIITATPVIRTGARTATHNSLHHWSVAGGAGRRLKRSLVRSGFMNVPGGSTPDPPHQFAHYDCAATTKDRPRPGLPHQSVDKLVKLRISHATRKQQFCCLITHGGSLISGPRSY